MSMLRVSHIYMAGNSIVALGDFAMSTTVSVRHLLTEQQRNNKRRRAQPQQLAILKEEFERNPKPDPVLRERIGRRADMTPRSVQIWFQNNRAKRKKGLEGGNRPGLRTIFVPGNDRVSSVKLVDHPFDTTMFHSSVSTAHITTVECSLLVIGQWARVSSNQLANPTLRVSYNILERYLSYNVFYTGHEYRIVVPIRAIGWVSLEKDPEDSNQGVFNLKISLPKEIIFDFKANDAAWWSPCSDFTGGEVSVSPLHQIHGSYHDLAVHVLPLSNEFRSSEDLLEA